MHMLQKTIAISGVNVVNVYKHAARNVYISSSAHTLWIRPTAM